MSSKDLLAVVGELGGVLQEVDESSVRALEEQVVRAVRVYVAGAGRSGLMMRAFAMRLMHLGLRVHVVGDVTTPAIAPGDLLVVGSGSGETESLTMMAQKARNLGAALALVTIAPTSSIGQLAGTVVHLDAPSPKAEPVPGKVTRKSIQPLGALFEQALLVLLDTVVMRLARSRCTSPEEMFNSHANLE
jgi:6-phospho-3-hexuloisomerase